MVTRRNVSLMGLGCVLIQAVASLGYGAPTSAVFLVTFNDARTDVNQYENSDGKQRWEISQGADSYQNEFYERPTAQSFEWERDDKAEWRYGAKEYFANLDIVTARAGRDDQFAYIEINLVGNYFHKEDNTKDFEGLKYQYGFRFATDPNGAGGYLMYGEFSDPKGEDPETFEWATEKTFGYWDKDGDIGGLDGLHVPNEGGGTGYEKEVIADGKLMGTDTQVLFMRMVGTATVQFALDYVALGLDTAYIDSVAYLDMQAVKGGPKDEANYFWNDKYNIHQAGTPYNDGYGHPQNIYELDTIRGGYFVPEPSAAMALWSLAGMCGIALAVRRPRKAPIAQRNEG